MRDELRHLQKLELEIAAEIKRICEKHHISYFMIAGTLLGAVRHGGFIPWDDDMDIGMLRRDYNRFVQVCKYELGDAFFLQTWDSDPEYPFSYAKIRLKGTRLEERFSLGTKMQNGIYVDIFPFDHVPDSPAKRRKQNITYFLCKRILWMKKGFGAYMRSQSFAQAVKYEMFRFAAALFPYEKVKSWFQRAQQKYNGTDSHLIVTDGAYSFEKETLLERWARELEPVPFEDTTFPAFRDRKAYLEHFYGDYMQLPPPAKRCGHSLVGLDFGAYQSADRDMDVGTLVSLVIPVYNTEKYLDRCITSVVNQTYEHLDIILVDDGSTDDCPGICDRWARRDSRIRVIHKQNAGLGMARNTGIDHARGSYICFIDSDDYVAPDLVEQALRPAVHNGAQIVLFGMGRADADGAVMEEQVPTPGKTLFTGSEIQEVLLPGILGPDPENGGSFLLSMSACRILLSTEVIRCSGWRFVSEREIISEDIYSMLGLYRHISRAAVVCKVLYYYCYNAASLTHTYRPDRYAKVKHMYMKCLEYAGECGYPEAVKYRCATPFLSGTFAVLKGEVATRPNLADAMHAVHRIVRDRMLQQVLSEHRHDSVNWKKQIFFWCVRHKMVIPCYILLRAKLKTERKDVCK